MGLLMKSRGKIVKGGEGRQNGSTGGKNRNAMRVAMGVDQLKAVMAVKL